MKASPAILSAAAIIVASISWMALGRPESSQAPPPDPAALHEGVLTVKTDPAEIFRRAFWRQPEAADKILHAERREWTSDSAAGPAYAQWFLAVEPGPGLTKWLREENAFGVRPVKSADVRGAPAWFPGNPADFEIRLGGTGGGLVFLFSHDGKTLYATGTGKGFTPGAAHPARPAPVATASIEGRLPLTPPPTPTRP